MVRRWAAWKSLQQAVVAASANNHITVLKLLWKAFNPAKYSALGAFSTVVEILNDASGNGHLRVVKLAVDAKYAKFVRRSGALAQAISGRRADVVEFLLGLGASWCDLVAAFVAASETSQDALAGRVYNVYREKYKGRPLLVELACRGGWTNAIKYLYSYEDSDPEVVNNAFISAAKRGSIATVKFLLGTNQVLPDSFDEAVEVAATRNNVDLVKFLCSTKRATPSSIDRAFVAANRTEVVKFLYENEGVSSEAVVAGFKQASGWGVEYSRFRFTNNEVKIFKLLYEDSRIQVEVVGRVLVQAASNGQAEIVALLRHDTRISAELRGEAFEWASTCETSDLMLLLYETADFSKGDQGRVLSRIVSPGEPEEVGRTDLH